MTRLFLSGVAAFLIAACGIVSAKAGALASHHIRSAVECIDRIDPAFLISSLTESYGQGSVASGAVHFNVRETMYGMPVTRFYVSHVFDVSTRPIYVAAVFDAKRDAVEQASLKRWIDGRQFGYSFNLTQGGMRAYQLNNQTIVMCVVE